MNRLNTILALVVFALALVCAAMLSWAWSFTDTTFGGWVGFGLPLLLCVLCFLAGYCLSASVGEVGSTKPAQHAFPRTRVRGQTKAAIAGSVYMVTTLLACASIGVLLAWRG